MTEERKKLSCTGCAVWPTIASVALNLFLVGVIVGPMMGPHDGGFGPEGRNNMPPPQGPSFMLEQAARDLLPEDAQKVRAIFKEERQGFQTRHENLHNVVHNLAEILRQDKPDITALHTAMKEAHAFGENMHASMDHALERVATEISPEGRKKIADVMERNAKRPPAPLSPPQAGDQGKPPEGGPEEMAPPMPQPGLPPEPDADGPLPPPEQ